jgi:eukaryotic-like serine/threonine-protein kinase
MAAGSRTSGMQIEHYEILSALGAGGMGEVYRARDKKLGRDVAMKVLPAAFAGDAERLARFQREAQVLASLNHPNIAQIYGVAESASTRCIVMELVEGETLQTRLRRGRVPVKEAIEIAKQVADAVEAAHERNILHRDLKPGNIMLTSEGRVKVLDFGLAKTVERHGDSGMSDSPTLLTSAQTQANVLMGTVAYMSPEQVRGKPLDKRTDVWAFGCVLFELLTGRSAFARETLNDTIASVLDEQEPDYRALPESTPSKIRDLIQRCLRIEVNRRLHDIADARIEMEDTLRAPEIAKLRGNVETARQRWRRALLWAASVAALVSIAAVVAFRLLPLGSSTTQSLFTQFAMELATDQQLAGVNVPAVALSPDGKQVAYVASRGGNSQLYLRALDSLAKPLPGTEGAYGPFFSSDGQWVGFFAGGKLKKIAINGGAPVVVADVPQACGASWANDKIIFTPFQFQGVMEVAASGGTPRALTNLDIQNGEI